MLMPNLSLKMPKQSPSNEQEIALMSLPEAISSRFLETKRRMETLKFTSEEEIENNRLEKLRKEGKLDDDIFPDPDAGPVPGGKGQLAIGGGGPRMLAIDDEMPPPPPGPPPNEAYVDEAETMLLSTTVKRV